MRARGSSLLGLVVTGVIAVPSAAFVLHDVAGGSPERRMELSSSSGAVAITSSADGQAVLSAGQMLPGDETSGTVTLSNSGQGPEALTLQETTPVDQAGPAGGRLSERLTLRVEDVSIPGAPLVVYDGPLSALPSTALGTWAAAEQRTYRFVVTFPDGGANGADNAYQGSSASVGFDWTADADGTTEPPSDAPYADQVGGDAPLGYWPLDGASAAMDDLLGHHDGHYADAITTADGAAPGGGQAAWFDGVAGYGYVNGLTAAATGYSFEAWVRPAADGDGVILEQGGGGALAIRDGHFAFREVDATLHSDAAATAGHWHQVVGTWDAATGVARIYVDGVLSGEGPAATPPSASSTLYVGRGSWPAGADGTTADPESDPSFFHGAMAQVSYYQTVLGADRIAAHYAAGRVAEPTTPAAQDPAPASPSADTPAPAPAPVTVQQGTTGATPSGSVCPGRVTAQGGKSATPAKKAKKAKKKKAPRHRRLTRKQRARARALARWHAARDRARARALAKARARARAACIAGGRAKASIRAFSG